MTRGQRIRAPSHSVWRAAAVAIIVVAVFVIGRWVGTMLPTPSGTSQPASCGARPETAVRLAEIGDFEIITEGRLDSLPLKGQRLGASPLPIVSAYRDGYVRGFISSRALTPEARALEADHDRALGYPADSFPVVPLAGPIVAANPGILELYQTTTVFRTDRAAVDWLDLRAGQLDGEEVGLDDAHVEGAARVFRYAMGDPDPEHELVLRLLVQAGTIVSDFSVQSGAEVSLDQAFDFIGKSITRVDECARQERETSGVEE